MPSDDLLFVACRRWLLSLEGLLFALAISAFARLSLLRNFRLGRRRRHRLLRLVIALLRF
jgi:hypothetical protein